MSGRRDNCPGDSCQAHETPGLGSTTLLDALARDREGFASVPAQAWTGSGLGWGSAWELKSSRPDPKLDWR